MHHFVGSGPQVVTFCEMVRRLKDVGPRWVIAFILCCC